METQRLSRLRARMDAVGNEGVKMWVQVERAAEALDQGDGAALPVRLADATRPS